MPLPTATAAPGLMPIHVACLPMFQWSVAAKTISSCCFCYCWEKLQRSKDESKINLKKKTNANVKSHCFNGGTSQIGLKVAPLTSYILDQLKRRSSYPGKTSKKSKVLNLIKNVSSNKQIGYEKSGKLIEIYPVPLFNKSVLECRAPHTHLWLFCHSNSTWFWKYRWCEQESRENRVQHWIEAHWRFPVADSSSSLLGNERDRW